MKENSKNNQLRELYDNVMLPNYSPASFIPERAEGSRLWDKDNKEYIDFGGGIAVNSLGHSHPDLIEALAVQSKKLWHLSNYLTNQPAIELAERLTKNTFAENVFFSNSGSEANETAIKIARKFFSSKGEKRDQIVSFKNSFHGRSLLNISLGSSKVHRNGFEPLMPGIAHGNFNELKGLETLINKNTAAVIVEPVQGAAGVYEATIDFLKKIREVTSENEVLLIIDEVRSGVGRTGSLYSYMNYDIAPDILTSAKGLGGGIPIGATLTTEAIGKSMQPGTHGSTFGGNPLAMAVGNSVIDIVSSKKFLNNVKKLSKYFFINLNLLKKKYPKIIREIRGKGLLIGVQRILPPLNVKKTEINQALKIIDDVCSRMS